MEDLTFNYYSIRAVEARFAKYINGFIRKSLPWVTTVFAIAGVVFLYEGMRLGWIFIALSVIPAVLHQYAKYRLVYIENGTTNTADALLTAEVLGKMPNNPTPKDIAEVVGSALSGQFMSMRFGLTPTLLATLASDDIAMTPVIWRRADEIRRECGLGSITASALAAAIVREFPGYEQVIAQIHLDDDDLDAGIKWRSRLVRMKRRAAVPRRTGGIARDWSFGWIPLLQKFGQNISEQISNGRLVLTVDVATHVESIDQLMDIFGGGGRQNAVLVGKSGSGKTTIINAFADRLLDARAKIPDSLKFRQIFILDSAALIASAPGRGELESIVMQVLAEAHNAKNIIICLDNAQMFFEEGVGTVDLSNVLLPIIEAGSLRIIFSMDEQRFLEIGQRNTGLVNALNRINIREADHDETMVVMQEALVGIEAKRNVIYMYQALKEAYRLSERYIHDMAMPGRAMKLLESAASYHESGFVTMNSVQQAIEKTLDVKISVAADSEDRDKLLHMEDLIHERMVNQTRAVGVVSDALRRARAGVRNQNRPIGTFLFLGPTGVGKTELSKAVAEVYFGGEDKLIRIDLNEYVRPDDVIRLIADGADDAGSLTAQVMRKPFSVVLLDEIEKAAPEVLTTLLQLLDEGILRDVKNREVSFRDAIVIATSNAGADRIREYIDRGYKMEQFEKQFQDELINSGQFRPEFLNRFDEIVLFRPFTREELLQIVDLILKGVNKTLEPQKICVTVTDDAKRLLVEKGYDPRLGARPMRRVVQKAVENTMAKLMLAGHVNPGDTVTITLEQVQRSYEVDDHAQQIINDISEPQHETTT